jgi:hypothetical protein
MPRADAAAYCRGGTKFDKAEVQNRGIAKNAILQLGVRHLRDSMAEVTKPLQRLVVIVTLASFHKIFPRLREASCG